MKIIETNLKFRNALVKRPRTVALVIHHTGGGRPGMDWGAKEIHQCHLNNGWSGAGYHFAIRKNGNIERCRPEYAIGAHCAGEIINPKKGRNWANASTIGIHVSGDFNWEKITLQQKKSLYDICVHLCLKYGIQSSNIVPHCQYGLSDCPGKLKLFIPELQKTVHNLLVQRRKK